eukprot:CAMPEP_0185433010 /NCGR_PEP_ID=MMETSP1365-20130426/20706_1 /TAXON_ID=38817 /ORGANISM="Gephyrocapsa oceanica, Strain RCC1303" /LENGTH=31 /DNA_ID= /DNA_START= /DNA_END= /DNA_ORIENTATION=
MDAVVRSDSEVERPEATQTARPALQLYPLRP